MKEGVLQRVEPPRELYDHPADMYVAGFIDSPRMNFIRVSLSGRPAASGFVVELPEAPGIEKGVPSSSTGRSMAAPSLRASTRTSRRRPPTSCA